MSDVIRNFKLYNASAGSGKTFTLIKEFFILSLSSDFPSYKNILAVTFTNKAASEMKTKILDNLKGIIYDDMDFEGMKNALLEELKIEEKLLKQRATRLYENILHNYSDLRVSTIDGFVQQISRSFAKELNLPNQYRLLIDEDDMIDELIQHINDKINKDDELITHTLSQYIKYQVSEEKSRNIEYYLRTFISELFKENAYKKGEAFEQKQIDNNQYKEIETYLDNKVNKLKSSIYDHMEEITRFNERHSIDVSDYLSVLTSMLKKIKKDIYTKPSDILNKTIKGVLYEGKKWHLAKAKNIALTEKETQELIHYFTYIVEKQRDLYLVNIVRKNLYLYVLRGALYGIINQYIEDTSKVHISEFNKRISDLIGDCSVPFIYERIGERFKHFFIDEFQDTSLLQWFNFMPLINNSMSEGNMNLLVGDAKQAIYRFRNGEVEQIINLPKIYKNPNNNLTNECERNFEDRISKEYLKVNYRSKKNIVKFNNSFFRKTRELLSNEQYRFVYEDKMEQKYKGSRNKDKQEYDGYVNVELFDDNADNSYKSAVKESVLKNINELRGKGYRLSDITILVRTNSEGSEIAQFLTNNHIRVISSDSILLKSSDKVQLIIYALKYLMNEDNALIRLSLSHYQNLTNKSNPDFDVQKTFDYEIEEEKLLELRGKAFSLYDLCCRILEIYDINILDDIFLQYFMNMVQDWQSRDDNDIKAFIEYWDKKSEKFYVKSASKEDAVEIMTIHKSKGLAFNIVMYPFANVKIPGSFKGGKKWLTFKNDFPLLSDMPLLEDFILPVNKGLLETDMECHYNEELEKAAFDDLNVIYVAMTRPVDMLYIFTKKTEKDNFFTDYFNDTGNHYYAEYDDNDNVASKEDFSFEMKETDKSIVYSFGEIIENEQKEEKGAKELVADTKDDYKTVDWYEMLDFESEPIMYGLDRKNDGYMPRERGIIIHEILSNIKTFDESESVLDKYIDDGIIGEDEARYLLNKFNEIANLKEIKEAYSKDAIVKNEMSILTPKGMLRPDRYVELEDKVVVIDYKTGTHREEYCSKQREYMFALQDMGIRKNIEGYLLYIGEKIEIIPVFMDRLF